MNVIYRYAPGAASSAYGAATAINSYPTVGGQAITYTADGAISQDGNGDTLFIDKQLIDHR